MTGQSLSRMSDRDRELVAKLCMVGAAGLLAVAEHLAPRTRTRRKEGNRK